MLCTMIVRFEPRKDVLRISAVEMEDSGQYVCCAENSHGQTCTNFSLVVQSGQQAALGQGRRSLSLHGWGDTQWPINPPTTVLLSFTFILPPAERCKVSQQVWNRVMN